MASNSLRCTLVTLFIFAMVMAPTLPCDASRSLLASGPICPACVCCTPPPPGSCCKCCASPIETQSQSGQSP
ncbi:Cell division cycle protein-like protein [Quillaja saponaria]|uniref:Cell division cycle protein-like protein n=1 Tax=Quillaja saponaria TaxID=32244 RepID=A0AAD7LS25_QUISA|nr:Cell division cycle protein-like protein [Quillaja saponaria]